MSHVHTISQRTKVYLSGGFYGSYKARIRELLPESVFELHDPEDGVPLPGDYVGQDLAAIRDSNLVIAHQGAYPYVYGMAAEVGYAAAYGRDVIYVCTGPRVDCFLAGLSRAIFTNIEAACEFVNERYPLKVAGSE